LNTDVLIFTGISDTDDLAGDLKRLCQIFEHIEKLLIFAASVHRKLIDAPRLAQSIFTDYFNYYLPKMGTSLESICYEKVSAILINVCILVTQMTKSVFIDLREGIGERRSFIYSV
jgi:Rab3 GTPase-activating protein catalytic subunit